MTVSLRILGIVLCAVLLGTGLGLLIAGLRGPGIAAMVVAVVLAVLTVVTLLLRSPEPPGFTEPGHIERLDPSRRNELVRGTSMHLRDMKYRYSVRFDRSDREPFTTDVNGVTLGFVPIVILDNLSDRQGYGYVAFPYDGARWRGPGLPCGGDRDEAVAHAARCVAPLDTDDEQ